MRIQWLLVHKLASSPELTRNIALGRARRGSLGAWQQSRVARRRLVHDAARGNSAHTRRYGPSFNLMKKTAKLGSVTDVSTGSSTWWENLKSFGGWGIRFGQVDLPHGFCAHSVMALIRRISTYFSDTGPHLLQCRMGRRMGPVHVRRDTTKIPIFKSAS